MNKVTKYLLILVVLLAATAGLAREAHAQSICAGTDVNERYVSEDGNDDAPGTAAQPWATLQYAVNTIGPGGTICVMPGTYDGFRIRISGTQAAPKAIRAVCPAVDPACAGDVSLINAVGAASRHGSFVEVERDIAQDPAGIIIEHWTIEGFKISGSSRYGIDCRSTEHISIINNVVQASVYTGIFFAHSDYTLAENNESYENGEHGLYAADSSRFPEIRGNYLHHNRSAGVHMNGGLGTGAGNGIIEGPLVEQNEISYNGLGGGAAINCDGVNGGLIRNNMAYKNSASGIALFKGNGAIASSNNKIYNNTFVMASPSRWVILIFKTGGSGGVNNDIKNNILYTPYTRVGSIATYSTSSSVLTSNYNDVVNRFNTDGARTAKTITLNQWQSRGQDRQSLLVPSNLAALFVNPFAVNPRAEDYRILPNSVADDNGVCLDDFVPDDFFGDPRPACALGSYPSLFDIGADEIVGTTIQGPIPDDEVETPGQGNGNGNGNNGNGNQNQEEGDPSEPDWESCAECADAVCEVDPFCCAGEWDFICAGMAQSLCTPFAEVCEAP